MEKRDTVISFKTYPWVKGKIKHIADLDDRSVSSQIERILKQKVEEWESEHGKIKLKKRT